MSDRTYIMLVCAVIFGGILFMGIAAVGRKDLIDKCEARGGTLVETVGPIYSRHACAKLELLP